MSFGEFEGGGISVCLSKGRCTLKSFVDLGWLVVCNNRGRGEHHGRVISACLEGRGVIGCFCVHVVLLLFCIGCRCYYFTCF